MSKYLHQLTQDCENKNCMQIFCRKHYNTNTIDAVSKTLEIYGDIFLCKNIDNLLKKNTQPYDLNKSPNAKENMKNRLSEQTQEKNVNYEQKKPKDLHKFIEVFFYIDNLVYKSQENSKNTPKNFVLKKNKASKKNINNKGRKNCNNDFLIKPYEDIRHDYCEIGLSRLLKLTFTF